MNTSVRRKHNLQVQKVRTKDRLNGLRIILDACFASFAENQQDFKEISNLTGLCLQTIKRLQSDKLTTMIRYDTLDRMVRCSGLYLQHQHDGVVVRLVE